MRTIDLNADLGESFGRWTLGDDEAMLDVVTSANVACGFHAGDPRGLLRVCEQAAERGVVVGAQVGYRDLAGFGRRFIDLEPADLLADVVYQIGALQGDLRALPARPCATSSPTARSTTPSCTTRRRPRAVVEAVRRVDPSLPLLGLPGSVLLRLAEAAGLPDRHRGLRRPCLHRRRHARPPQPKPARCCTTLRTVAARAVADGRRAERWTPPTARTVHDRCCVVVRPRRQPRRGVDGRRRSGPASRPRA